MEAAPDARTVSRWRRLLRDVLARTALLVGALLVALLVAELATRALIPPAVDAFFTPFEHDDSPYAESVEDPETAKTLRWYLPGREGTTGSAPVHINTLGLRDEQDYAAQPPAGCFRVLVLGDSMTFGKGVAAEETWPAVLEQRLRAAHPAQCVEVLNAGMPNTNFHVQWLHFQSRWHALKPQLVLVGFFPYNDTQLEGEEEPYSLRVLEFVDRHAWLKRSALVRWAYHRTFFDLGARKVKAGIERFFAADYAGWKQFELSLAALVARAQEQAFRLAFALIPIPEGYTPYPFAAVHERLSTTLQRQFRVPVWDTVRALDGVDARAHWIHPSDGHPDPFVHRAIGEHLARAMPWAAWLASR